MAAMWFLVFYLLLATASSLAELQESELQQKQSGIHLNIYHVQGSLSPKSPSFFSDVLSRDEERVKALHSRLANKDASSSTNTTYASSLKKSRGPKSSSIPLHSGLSIGSGNYYVKIGLGTPAKYYTMVLDTGSSFSWLQCRPCVVYCHTQVDPLFDPSSSMTYKNLSCSTSQCSSLKNATLNDPSCDDDSNACLYTASYGDTSFSVGYLSQDLLTLTPSQTLPRFVYGCGQYNQGLFGKTAGIVGLARDQLSMIAQLSTKYGYAFSYCLPRASASTSTRGGFLSIGNSSLAAFSAYKFTPMFTDSHNPDLYFLKLKAITVAGRQLGVAAAKYMVPTIIDSGTVITRLPVPVYTALRQAFVKIMSKKYEQAPEYFLLDTCFKGSLKSISELVPKIQLIFQGGADLTLKTPNVLIEANKGITCLAFASSSGPHQIAIIGNYQQQTFGVAYDVSNSRIKFAAGGCH